MKVKRVLERNLENRKNTKTLSIQVGQPTGFSREARGQPFRRERFKSTFEDKRLKEGGCHETIYKSGI
eukprot:SAG11_NODE_27872_length_327_cov_10.815789_1_plen_67_part_10